MLHVVIVSMVPEIANLISIASLNSAQRFSLCDNIPSIQLPLRGPLGCMNSDATGERCVAKCPSIGLEREKK